MLGPQYSAGKSKPEKTNEEFKLSCVCLAQVNTLEYLTGALQMYTDLCLFLTWLSDHTPLMPPA